MLIDWRTAVGEAIKMQVSTAVVVGHAPSYAAAVRVVVEGEKGRHTM